ncbi:hypothetical protein HDU77_006691 [Chytriomyces hyalinus]|nr:hypothetical protein HDU77_006691 [Chytriomyces hyalinus]
MSDLNWCSCGKATQPGTMYCSTLCRTADEESNKPTSSSSWSLDNAATANNINTSSPIAFYPYNHFANVAMQSPRSPFMTLLPQTTPKFAAAASPRFTGSSSRGGVSSSPFALGSVAGNGGAGNLGASASIPFLALPQSELDLPPLELDGSKKLEVGGNLSGATRMDPLVSKSRRASANIHFSPLSHPTSAATVAVAPVVSNHPRTSVRNILESPMMSGRIPPPSPRMTGGSQDMSCAAGPNGGGLMTVAGSNAMLDDCYVSLAFNNRVRK